MGFCVWDKSVADYPRLENEHSDDKRIMRAVADCAGGLLDEEGKMKGSVLILDFPSRRELDAYLAAEPYVEEKVWEKIEIETLNVVIGGK